MDRVRRISQEILEKHRSLFTESYEENKRVLSEVAMIRSKQLRNEILGCITSLVRKEGEVGKPSEG